MRMSLDLVSSWPAPALPLPHEDPFPKGRLLVPGVGWPHPASPSPSGFFRREKRGPEKGSVIRSLGAWGEDQWAGWGGHRGPGER